MADLKTEEYYTRIQDLIDANDVLVSTDAKVKNCERIARLCDTLGTYKDCEIIKKKYTEKAEAERYIGLEKQYCDCLIKFKNADSIDTYTNAEILLKQLGAYKNAKELADLCHKKALKMKLKKQIALWIRILILVLFVSGLAMALLSTFHRGDEQHNITVTNVAKGIRITPADPDYIGSYVIYREVYNVKTKDWSKAERIGSTAADAFYTDENVYPGTMYRYAAVEEDNAEQSPEYFTSMVRITTREIVELMSDTPSSFTVRWSGSTVFTGYQIQYTDEEGSFSKAENVLIDSKDKYSTRIDGLTENATYYVRVRSYHRMNNTLYYGGWSPTVGVTLASEE
ncbi:MAG: fibronectin type III domain-containing protein [Solobacterium sp.]|nr:fibronectin type III domain-containing protein [Solobacterium sp.]